MSVLQRIIAYKREEVAARRKAFAWGALDDAIAQQTLPRGFESALRAHSGDPALIAEIKKASPSKGTIRADFDPSALARAYAEAGAACLSVLTDEPSFHGNVSHLAHARRACKLPLLRKDFLIDDWQVAESRAFGADAILIILAAVDDALASDLADAAAAFGMDALVEVHDETELDRALRLGCKMLGVNNRSLATFETDLAVTERLAVRVPPEVLLVSESGISTRDDVLRLKGAGVGAVLVGESLMRAPDVAAATRRLLGH